MNQALSSLNRPQSGTIRLAMHRKTESATPFQGLIGKINVTFQVNCKNYM